MWLRRAKPRAAASLVRHFLYVDTEEVLNLLSCFNDGDIEDRTTKTIQSMGGGIKASIPYVLGTLDLEGKRSRTLEEEVRRKRTVYSAITELLKRLRASDDLRQLDTDEPQEFDFQENELIEFAGDIELYPARQTPKSSPPWWSGLWSSEARRRRARRATLDVPAYIIARMRMGSDGPWAVMRLDADYLAFREMDDFRRLVTVVGQLIALPNDGEESLLIVETESGWIPKLGEVKVHRGTELTDTITDPWVVLRALCIFK